MQEAAYNSPLSKLMKKKEKPSNNHEIERLNKQVKRLESVTIFVIEETLMDDFLRVHDKSDKKDKKSRSEKKDSTLRTPIMKKTKSNHSKSTK